VTQESKSYEECIDITESYIPLTLVKFDPTVEK